MAPPLALKEMNDDQKQTERNGHGGCNGLAATQQVDKTTIQRMGDTGQRRCHENRQYETLCQPEKQRRDADCQQQQEGDTRLRRIMFIVWHESSIFQNMMVNSRAPNSGGHLRTCFEIVVGTLRVP